MSMDDEDFKTAEPEGLGAGLPFIKEDAEEGTNSAGKSFSFGSGFSPVQVVGPAATRRSPKRGYFFLLGQPDGRRRVGAPEQRSLPVWAVIGMGLVHSTSDYVDLLLDFFVYVRPMSMPLHHSFHCQIVWGAFFPGPTNSGSTNFPE